MKKLEIDCEQGTLPKPSSQIVANGTFDLVQEGIQYHRRKKNRDAQMLQVLKWATFEHKVIVLSR